MTRTSLPIAVALAASAGLLLTACGGSGSSSDKITSSATTPVTAAPTTTASPTQAAGPDAPKFALPQGVDVDFQGFTSSDATKNAVLRDATYAATAVVETEALGKKTQTPNLKRFFPSEQGAELADQLISYAKTGKVATGSFRYYKASVTENQQAGSVTVSFCEDQRKAYDKDAKTGKVTITKPSLKSFNSWTYVMSKTSSGEWHVFNYRWNHGVAKCQGA